MIPYALMYRLGFAPWERRDVAESWRPILDGPHPPVPARALDVGCGSGHDAVYLAKRGWRVTAVDLVDKALARAKRRAAEEGVEVQWVRGDVARLGWLGLEPGYTLLYDFGCIQGLPDSARAGATAGLTELAAPGATLLVLAFKASRRIMLPRGMDEQHIIALLGGRWDLEHTQRVVTEDMPPPVQRASPTVYRLTRRSEAARSSVAPVGQRSQHRSSAAAARAAADAAGSSHDNRD
jgi:SAM-dependent methyltransferase